MPTSLENFVTTTQDQGDIMPPELYRSVMEQIIPLYKANLAVRQARSDMEHHIVDYDDPHDDSSILSKDITYMVWELWSVTATPAMSYDEFMTNIWGTSNMMEVIRRIQLNRVYFDKVKSPQDMVFETEYASLSNDFRLRDQPELSEVIAFGTTVTGETAFAGIPNNPAVTDRRYIQTFDETILFGDDTNTLFATSSSSPYLDPFDVGTGYTVSIQQTIGELGVDLTFIGVPSERTTILSINTQTDTRSIVIDDSRKLYITDGTTDIFGPQDCKDGRFIIQVDLDKLVTVHTAVDGDWVSGSFTDTVMTSELIRSLGVAIQMENPSYHLYMGVPDGAILYLVDDQGRYVVDDHGQPIVANDVTAGATTLGVSEDDDVVTGSGEIIIPVQFAIRDLRVFDNYLNGLT